MRRRRYVWMMGIRIVVFVAAVALPLPIPVVIALMVVAVLLPWIAVQTANVGPLPERGHRPHREGWAPRQLPGSGPRAEL